MLKAIETVYNGYRFRSRLEARWAVFFDALRVPYGYEQEGFTLSDGERYLPDFWLPQHSCWVEIKPTSSHESKCRMLAIDSGRYVLCIAGTPGIESYGICLYNPDRTYTGESTCAFATGRKCDDELWVEHPDFGAWCLNPITHAHDGKYPTRHSTPLVTAYTAARQARFEHGESPRVPR